MAAVFPRSSGGDGTVITSAPISGDGSVLTPVTVADGAVANAKLANMTAHTFKARKTNSTGVPEDATATEATALLNLATDSLPGLESAAQFTTLLKTRLPKAGTNLTDANQTLQPVTDKASQYTQVTTLTGNRTKTLGVTNGITGLCVRIVREDTANQTLAVINGGTNGGTLLTFAASPSEIQAATFFYNGVDWVLAGFEYLTT